MGTSLQIRNYPRPESGEMEEGQMGFGAHNDSGFLTIVHTQTAGLQVRTVYAFLYITANV